MQIFNGRTSFFQWDLNQKLIISDTVHNEVHFAREGDENALVVRVREENGQRVVDVPNILLQTADKIVAYMYGDNETESHTHFYKKFSVKKRPKPDDYVYTETEVNDFNSKLDKNLGKENAGKTLYIDDDGNVSLGDSKDENLTLTLTVAELIKRVEALEKGVVKPTTATAMLGKAVIGQMILGKGA